MQILCYFAYQQICLYMQFFADLNTLSSLVTVKIRVRDN
jgi:hypothetical protein